MGALLIWGIVSRTPFLPEPNRGKNHLMMQAIGSRLRQDQILQRKMRTEGMRLCYTFRVCALSAQTPHNSHRWNSLASASIGVLPALLDGVEAVTPRG
jgi:hypothetical protein